MPTRPRSHEIPADVATWARGLIATVGKRQARTVLEDYKESLTGTFCFTRGLRLMRVRACHAHPEHHEVGLLTMS